MVRHDYTANLSAAAFILAGMITLAVMGAAPGALGDSPTPDSRLQAALTGRIGARDAVMVTSADGTIQAQINADLPLVPASILKILTALAALETLGSDFHFNTDFLADEAGNLKIKGYGDPLLVSERLQSIARSLAMKRQQFGDIILDDTYIEQPLKIPGRGASTQPYDAPNGALCVNFNTVAFERKGNRWVSAEAQTPLLPSVIPKIKATGLSSGRITLAGDSDEALQYTGELFHYFLNQAGVRTTGAVRRGAVDYRSDILLWQHRSEDNLGEVLRALLEFSNNFMANQILLVMGAHAYGPPATLEKGLAVITAFYHKTLGMTKGRIVEASGISRRNRLTARGMVTILNRFEPHHALLRSIAGQYYKTGHLKGIRTRAGYLADRSGSLYRFALLLNTPGKATGPIMQIIQEQLGTKGGD